MLFDNNIVGVFFEEEFKPLKFLEGRKQGLLSKEEIGWILKSRAIKLFEGNRNIKFLHKFASHRRRINTI